MLYASGGLISVAVVTLLATMQAAPTSSDPFFSNDAVGFIKVLAFFAGIVGVTITAVVKFAQSGLKADLTGIGRKVDDKTTEYDRAIARLDERITATNKEVAGVSRDITTLITATNAEMGKQLTELTVEIARMQERDRLSVSLDRFRAELTDEFRREHRRKDGD